jgi:hypothetical protein
LDLVAVHRGGSVDWGGSLLRSKIGVFLGVVALAVLAVLAGAGTASASTGFTAQAEAAGLSAGKADALQAKVDAYLVKLKGRGTQVSPNQIDLGGAVLNVTVPGETKPRQLGALGVASVIQCNGGTLYGWFCAYQYEYRGGDNIGMYNCDSYFIPWSGPLGSWENNQTSGTVPTMHWIDGTSGRMPAAYSIQRYGVWWDGVYSITNC